MNFRRAFTLVELLMVIALLAILAAVAIPNLLAAQTRAKVARVKSDLRTLAAAIEAYSGDHGRPPLDWSVARGEPQYAGMEDSTSGILYPGRADAAAPGGVRPGLTTPVAYVTQCWVDDPFVAGSSYGDIPFDQQKYTYNWFGPMAVRQVEPSAEYLFQKYDSHYGAWRLGSVGPDRDFFHEAGLYGASRIYDPTNGARSPGNIWRSLREAEVRTRPPLDVVLDPQG